MKDLKEVCVVIPVHLSLPKKEELISYIQCIRILSDHDIFIVCPNGMDVSFYTDIYPSAEVKFVDRDWLSSIKAYNKMKIDISFYKLFSNYKYMLTYELDSFVFRDELSRWCKYAFDYIGAPWFSGYHKASKTGEIIGVGNSGFSLRNVQKCLLVLRQIRPLISMARRTDFFPLKYLFRLMTFALTIFPAMQLSRIRIIRAYLNHEYVHEDIFWCKFVPLLLPDFKIATVEDALNFSFDASPSQCYQMTNGKLPFGCHAWTKFDPQFWKQFIPEQSNN